MRVTGEQHERHERGRGNCETKVDGQAAFEIGIAIQVVEDVGLHDSDDNFQSQYGRCCQNKKDGIDAPVGFMATSCQHDKRGAEDQSDRNHGDLENQNYQLAVQHRQAPFASYPWEILPLVL